MNPEQEQKLNEVYEFMQSLKNDATIPFEVDSALRSRFNLDTRQLTVSSKGANSEDVTVDEAGAATLTVLNDPVGFLKITIDSTTYHLPYFNA